MKTRAVGVLLVLAGLAGVILGGWGFSMTDDMSKAPSSQPFDAQDWSFHWRAASIYVVALSIPLGVAGLAMFKGRRWGFVVLSLVAFVAAITPWLLNFLGFSHYAFEKPGVLESAIFVAVGIAALRARGPRHDG